MQKHLQLQQLVFDGKGVLGSDGFCISKSGLNDVLPSFPYIVLKFYGPLTKSFLSVNADVSKFFNPVLFPTSGTNT